MMRKKMLLQLKFYLDIVVKAIEFARLLFRDVKTIKVGDTVRISKCLVDSDIPRII